mmetsp:Transcript_43414/g.76151  ORF Transcript_43414/g.76151 Transcript_43414/m.76151 type:complete len:168 (+) Transcript_43414:1-504(+)
MRGVSDTTVISVCLYEGNGSNRKVGCVTGTTEGKNHLMIDSVNDTETLNPCETYFALANTTGTDDATGKAKRLWSSTSVTWNGPCAHNSHQADTATTAASFEPTMSRSPVVSFEVGLLVGMAVLFLMNHARKNNQIVEHSKIYPICEEPVSYTGVTGEEEAETIEMT